MPDSDKDTTSTGDQNKTRIVTRSQSKKEAEMEARLEALLNEARQPKLPPYDSKKLDLWFRRVETEFAALGIVDDSAKYFAVLRALDGPTTEEVADIMDNPPAEDKYLNLKEKITERLGVSKKDKLRQVIKGIYLGGKKPSQLLREMKSLSTGVLPDDALHGLWVEKLPTELRAFLAMSDDLSLEQLANMADRIIPEICHNNTIMAVTGKPHKDTSLPLVTALIERIEYLEKTVADLAAQFRSFKLSNRRSRSHSRGRSLNRSDICYNHQRYGHNTRNCRPPCAFLSQNQQNQENNDRCRQ